MSVEARNGMLGGLLLGVLLLATPAQAICVGDCNGDFEVLGNEVTVAVGIVSGNRSLSDCSNADMNDDGDVFGNEITAAVRFVADGCTMLTGDDATEAGSGVGSSTLETHEMIDLGYAGPQGGGGAAAAAPGFGGVLLGIAPQTCTDGGRASFFCTEDANSTTYTAVYDDCESVDGKTGTTTFLDGTLVRTTPEAGGCRTPIVADCSGPDGRVSYDGILTVVRPADGTNVSITYRDFSIEVASTRIDDLCFVLTASDGSADVNDRARGRRFSQVARNFVVSVQQQQGGGIAVTEDGVLSTDCVGDLRFFTIEDLQFEPGSLCPSQGIVDIGFSANADCDSPGPQCSRLLPTQGGGLNVDYQRDGNVDLSVSSCTDRSVAQCVAFPPPAPTATRTPTPRRLPTSTPTAATASDCCVAHGLGGCAVGACQECVCALDDFCCFDEWDSCCVDTATFDCANACSCTSAPTPTPAAGSNCCSIRLDSGCDSFSCESCVCGEDDFCCTDEWDELCVELTAGDCSDVCACASGPTPTPTRTPTPGAASNCCSIRGVPGCDTPSCESCVCGEDDFCCAEEWDDICVDLVTIDCSDVCTCASGPTPTPTPGSGSNNPPRLDRVDRSRTTMANGKLDDLRSAGVGSVAGVSTVVAAIAARPNPLLVTLDDNGDGSPDPTNPIVTAAAALPSCLTLAVAEGVSDPDGHAVGVRWEYPGVRFGDGNIYAAVGIPSAGITAGQELVTNAQLNSYTANTLFYEPPDVGPIIQDHNLNGGTESVTGRAVDFPPPPLASLMSAPRSGQIEYDRAVHAEIVEVCKRQNQDGSFSLRLQVDVLGNFDPLDKSTFRWSFEGNNTTIIRDIPASSLVQFDVPSPEAGTLARITVVGSSLGSAVSGNPNPFVNPPGSSVGLTTFNSSGCTVSDTESVTVTSSVGQEICGDGIDNDCDDMIDEDCDFGLLVDDNQCRDDTIGVVVDGQNLGQTPTGQARFFDVNQFGSGEHTLEVVAIASGGAAFGCSANPIVSFGVQLQGGAVFVQRDGSPFTGTSDSGEIDVGERRRYTIRL